MDKGIVFRELTNTNSKLSQQEADFLYPGQKKIIPEAPSDRKQQYHQSKYEKSMSKNYLKDEKTYPSAKESVGNPYNPKNVDVGMVGYRRF